MQINLPNPVTLTAKQGVRFTVTAFRDDLASEWRAYAYADGKADWVRLNREDCAEVCAALSGNVVEFIRNLRRCLPMFGWGNLRPVEIAACVRGYVAYRAAMEAGRV